MRRAYLSFLGCTPQNSPNISLKVLDLPMIPLALTGVKWLRAGQVILVVCSRDDEPLALYTIHKEGRPQQIWGASDLLLDQVFLQDLTPLYLPTLRMTEALIMSAYEHLEIEEMIQYKSELLTWENACIEHTLGARSPWKICRATALELADSLTLPSDITHRMSAAIQQTACPKKEHLQAPIRVDLWGYPGDKED